ncbi:MAG: AIR synthase-related protein [Phycisphaerae bacterium]|nr:AIR synthase-related protein [Phycisphaerae bacterium]
MSGWDYKSAGIDYEILDAFKRACQREAQATQDALEAHGLRLAPQVRGESAFVLEGRDEFLAHVEEGLGTKNLVADAMRHLTGRCFYHAIGIDLVATIVNDLITCGALPVCVAMHAAAGDSRWFEDTARAVALARGFAEGCRLAGAVWGGGETPALPGMVEASTIVLAGSAIGRISPKSHRITGDIRPGDQIILLASSGVQTNGLSLCRALAGTLPDGYLTPMGDGRLFGEALLDASHVYVRVIADLLAGGIVPSGAAHITGHGWRKLMRSNAPVIHRISEPGSIPPIFQFIQHQARLDDRQMYATFNMGAGFALWVHPDQTEPALAIARRHFRAWRAGECVQAGKRKAVEILPAGIVFESDTLQLR